MRLALLVTPLAAIAACSPPSPQPQPEEMETVNVTRYDQAAPDNALGNSTDAGNAADTQASDDNE